MYCYRWFYRYSQDKCDQNLNIEGPLLFRQGRGTFLLKIHSQPATNIDLAPSFSYIFDGPIRFSRHFFPTIGKLTHLDDARLYSTWKLYIIGVPLFFGNQHQSWNNKSYKAAQWIFQGPASLAVRSGIEAGHRMLYARKPSNLFGTIESTQDILDLLHSGANSNASQFAQCVRPAVYTYVISAEDDSFRFSETGAAFLVDFASKHALHSNCAESVRYSAEFHPRPAGGWSHFSDDIPDDAVGWELVVDNNSGT